MESYALAWYFAGLHTRTDAWDKRKTKGFVFTIGDEPVLPHYPLNAVKHIMGTAAIGQDTYTAKALLELAQEKNHVYHIHIDHGSMRGDAMWKDLLGQNFIVIKDHHEVAKTISQIILAHPATVSSVSTGTNPTSPDIPEML